MSVLEEKPEKIQVNTLIYCISGNTEDILATFRLSQQDSENLDSVKARFHQHFMVGTNVTYEWVKFNRYYQAWGDSFVTD